MSAGNQRVVVAVRVRPMLREGSHLQAQEKFELQAAYRTGDTSLKVELTKPGEPAKSSTFTFDYIFDEESTQLEVYEDAVMDMVDATLVGVNATVLAYGQTGSGKTFTMLGNVQPNPLENDLLTSTSGMFLRVLSDLMDYKLRQAKKGWHVVVGLSCVEIYLESIRDLFGGKANQDPPPLKAVMINDDVLLPSLTVKEMTSLQGVFEEIQLAINRRRSRATEANSTSSRSHCLFMIDIMQQAASAPPPTVGMLEVTRKNAEERSTRRKTLIATNSPTSRRATRSGSLLNQPCQLQQELPPWEMPFQGSIIQVAGQKEPIYSSKIILADLAGSERIARTGVTGAGLSEATSINGSLTALGNVVHSLHEGSYVSYRTSNLTCLLKPTFSQMSSRVLLLAQCSPTQLTFEETISTLHFANKVKQMKVTTTTGAEAEKLQFDFLEVGKTYDAILADLHIFAEQECAKVPVIRRIVPQNKGMYYDQQVCRSSGKAKGNACHRKAHVDSIGATTAAENERDATKRRLEKEAAENAEKKRQAVAESSGTLVKEHQASMREATEGIAEQKAMRSHHNLQEVKLSAAATGNILLAQESCDWAILMTRFRRELRTACRQELTNCSEYFESISRDLNKLRLVCSTDTSGVKADEETYALSAWHHCVGKRFFSRYMELREKQMQLLTINCGNAALMRWKGEHKDILQAL